MKSKWAEYISFSHDEGGKMAALSDGGAGVARIMNALDGEDARRGNLYQCRAKAARAFVRRNAPSLLTVLNLILEHGNNRKEAIWKLMKLQTPGKRRKRNTTKR